MICYIVLGNLVIETPWTLTLGRVRWWIFFFHFDYTWISYAHKINSLYLCSFYIGTLISQIYAKHRSTIWNKTVDIFLWMMATMLNTRIIRKLTINDHTYILPRFMFFWHWLIFQDLHWFSQSKTLELMQDSILCQSGWMAQGNYLNHQVVWCKWTFFIQNSYYSICSWIENIFFVIN